MEMNIITPYNQRPPRERELFQVDDTYTGVIGDYGYSNNGNGYPLYHQTEGIQETFYHNNHVSYGYDESGEVINTCHCAGVTNFDESSQNVYHSASVGFRDAVELWSGEYPAEDDAFYNGQNANSRIYEQSSNYPQGTSNASQIPEFMHISETGHHYEPPSSLIQGEGFISISSFTSEDSYRPLTLPSQSFLPQQVTRDVQFVPLSSNSNSYPVTIPISISPSPENDNQGSLASLLPDQHSTYSELSANLVYMASLSEPQGSIVKRNKKTINLDRRRREKGPSTKPRDKQYRRIAELTDIDSITSEADTLIPQMDWTGVASTSTSSSITSSTSEATIVEGGVQIHQVRTPTSIRGGGLHSQPTANKPLIRLPQTKQIPPPASIAKSIAACSNSGSGSGSGSGTSTGKKLGLACLFCRERKIACGRPPESHPDQRCNQCARRAFKCEYPTESRRGQHKRPKAKPGVT